MERKTQLVGIYLIAISVSVIALFLYLYGPKDLFLSGILVTTTIVSLCLALYSIIVIIKRYRKKPYIYISYPKGYDEKVDKIVKYYQSSREIVLSREVVPPGRKYIEVLEPFMAQSQFAVVCLSKDLDGLQKTEIKVLKQKGIRIIPVVETDDDLPQSLEGWKPLNYSFFES